MIQNLRLFINRMKAKIPEPLPANKEELDRLIDSVITLYGLPNRPDYHRTIVTMIQHLATDHFKAPKYYFYSQIRRSEAMRAAFFKLKELNDAEKQAATPNKELHVGENTLESADIGMGSEAKS